MSGSGGASIPLRVQESPGTGGNVMARKRTYKRDGRGRFAKTASSGTRAVGASIRKQDATVLGHVLDSGRALVIAVNKWDGQSNYQRDQTRALLDRKLSFCTWAEQVTISAKHGTGMRELFNAIRRAHASATREFERTDTFIPM